MNTGTKEFFKLADSVYDALTWIVKVLLPGVAAFYLAMSEVFSLPYPKEIAATIAAVIVFLGLFLQVKNATYKMNQVISGVSELRDKVVRFVMSDNLYNTMKFVFAILLPAISVLYLTLADVWNLPYAEAVTSVIAALVIFGTSLLQISSSEYKKAQFLKTSTTVKNHGLKAFLVVPEDLYNFVKMLAMSILPGLATFYVTLAQIWSLPYGEQVAATLMAFVAFINALLQVSSFQYHKAVAKLNSRQ